jgi:HK97 family phage prohead protease
MIHSRGLLIEAKGAKRRRGESANAETKAARFLDCKFVSGGDPGVFEGYASIFGNEDGGGDVMMQGAFTDTLKEHKDAGSMPHMLLNHGSQGGPFGADPMADLPIGKWLGMSEDTRGLQCKGQLINLETDAGKRVYGCMKEGVLNGLSIGYQPKDFSYGSGKPGEPNRKLKSVHLIEVSPVTFPMNRLATITNVKADGSFDPREMEEALREAGLSQTHAVRAVAIFRKRLRRDVGWPAIPPRDEAGIGDAIRGPFEAFAKLIRS